MTTGLWVLYSITVKYVVAMATTTIFLTKHEKRDSTVKDHRFEGFCTIILKKLVSIATVPILLAVRNEKYGSENDHIVGVLHNISKISGCHGNDNYFVTEAQKT